MQNQDHPQRPVVLMEDELVHTPEHPFCSDADCPCYEDPHLLAEVAAAVQQGLLTAQEATLFAAGKTI